MALTTMIRPKYRDLLRIDVEFGNVIPGCPMWTEVLALALRQLAYFEMRFSWFVSAALRRYIVRVHIYLAGVCLGRTFENPDWQPEECTSHYWISMCMNS